ncbi:MAG: hypothetical protein F4Y45_14380 [Acidobacteria bacterium]|nr:hypothetical protein [Acidobacteriota bacterium]MYJ03171.1 hypothetical protein [Acidobacteriota bacterium]
MSTVDETGSTAASPSARSAPGANSGFMARIARVFSFDTSVYPEVAAAPATGQAIVVVSVAATLSGGVASLVLFFFVVPGALVFLAVQALLVMLVTRLFGGHPAAFIEWYRALGFAQAPLVVGLVPLLGWIVAPFYSAAAQVTAISRVARLSTGMAFLALLLTWLPFFLAGLLFALVAGVALLGVLGLAST